MRWHRNPFFHTAVLPPSVAPSTMTSARPSADLDRATAAATAARKSTTEPPRASTDGIRVSFTLPREGGDSNGGSGSGSGGGSNTAPPLPHAPQHGGLLAEATARLAATHGHDYGRDHGIDHESGNDSGHENRSGGIRTSIGARLRRHRAAPRVPKLTICEPSDRLTPYQAFYIFGLDGLGACVLSGGINFAIGYAMYKTIDAEKHPIRLFQFPNTLAGDAAVTIFLQCIITWFIELLLVNRDLRSGHIQPIGFLREPTQPLLRWFLLLDRQQAARGGGDGADVEAAEENAAAAADDPPPDDPPPDASSSPPAAATPEKYEPGSWQHWAVFLVSQLLRALLVGVASFLLLWPLSIGILTAVGQRRPGSRDWWFDDSQGASLSWAPPVFKLVLGGVLALLTTPPFAAFWLVRCGWAVQANHRHLGAA